MGTFWDISLLAWMGHYCYSPHSQTYDVFCCFRSLKNHMIKQVVILLKVTCSTQSSWSNLRLKEWFCHHLLHPPIVSNLSFLLALNTKEEMLKNNEFKWRLKWLSDKSAVTVEHLKKTDIGSFYQYFIDIQTFNSYWFFWKWDVKWLVPFGILY